MRPIISKNQKKPGPPTKPKANRSKGDQKLQPLEVFCRLRPLKTESDHTVLRAISDNELQVSLPESTANLYCYTFKRVFSSNSTQNVVFDKVAHPLVQNLISGQNGLLFTYGVTSAGKTFTITGTPKCPGILPRTLDLLFNSLNKNNLQSMKYLFKPDGQNGFDIVATPEAILKMQNDLQKQNATSGETPVKTRPIDNYTRTPLHSAAKKLASNQNEWRNRQRVENIFIKDINCDNNYSVFVSYVEIYNNYIYDLLDESYDSASFPSTSGAPSTLISNGMRNNQPSSKALREDIRNKRVYVQGVCEAEVKNADEAFDLFLKGVLRRRIGSTALNAESSRSHSVFTIRLAQAPLDLNGTELIDDKRYVHISQLSIVDLAGCERTARTNATGNRLKEASNINNSLMTLRSCFDALRENQKSPSSTTEINAQQVKKVPYRDSKLTHLFKSYFEGDGAVKMVLCLNPGAEDYDETLQVLKFGEQSQEIMTTRSRGTAVRTRAAAVNDYQAPSENDLLAPITFGPSYPKRFLTDASDDRIIPEWISVAEKRKVEFRNAFVAYSHRMASIRATISELERENTLAKQESSHLKLNLQARESQIHEYESHFLQQKREIEDLNAENGELKHMLRARERDQRQLEHDLCTVRSSIATQLENERKHMKQWCIGILNQKQAELEQQKCLNQEKLELVKQILTDDTNILLPNINNHLLSPLKTEILKLSSQNQTFPPPDATNVKSTIPIDATATSQTVNGGPPVINPRFGVGPSAAPNDKWLEHRPPGTLDTGTILQPTLKNRKSVTNLKPSDFLNKNYTKYAVTHNKATDNGAVETEVFKGDVIPSVSGGAQVIFNDIETLKQGSPLTFGMTTRKRVALFEQAAVSGDNGTPSSDENHPSTMGTPTTATIGNSNLTPSTHSHYPVSK